MILTDDIPSAVIALVYQCLPLMDRLTLSTCNQLAWRVSKLSHVRTIRTTTHMDYDRIARGRQWPISSHYVHEHDHYLLSPDHTRSFSLRLAGLARHQPTRLTIYRGTIPMADRLVMSSMTSLRELSVSSWDPQQNASMMNWLAQMTQLTSLTINGTLSTGSLLSLHQLKQLEVRRLVPSTNFSLMLPPSITSLIPRGWESRLTRDDMIRLLAALPQLTHLDVSHISDDATHGLLPLIVRHASLRSLQLQQAAFDATDEDAIAHALAEQLAAEDREDDAAHDAAATNAAAVVPIGAVLPPNTDDNDDDNDNDTNNDTDNPDTPTNTNINQGAPLGSGRHRGIDKRVLQQTRLGISTHGYDGIIPMMNGFPALTQLDWQANIWPGDKHGASDVDHAITSLTKHASLTDVGMKLDYCDAPLLTALPAIAHQLRALELAHVPSWLSISHVYTLSALTGLTLLWNAPWVPHAHHVYWGTGDGGVRAWPHIWPKLQSLTLHATRTDDAMPFVHSLPLPAPQPVVSHDENGNAVTTMVRPPLHLDFSNATSGMAWCRAGLRPASATLRHVAREHFDDHQRVFQSQYGVRLFPTSSPYGWRRRHGSSHSCVTRVATAVERACQHRWCSNTPYVLISFFVLSLALLAHIAQWPQQWYL